MKELLPVIRFRWSRTFANLLLRTNDRGVNDCLWNGVSSITMFASAVDNGRILVLTEVAPPVLIVSLNPNV